MLDMLSAFVWSFFSAAMALWKLGGGDKTFYPFADFIPHAAKD